jgi:hypothetical protein
MGLFLMFGLAGLVLIGGFALARALAESRSEPALGERYASVSDSDLTIARRRRSDSGDVGGGADDGGDGGGD